MKNQNIQDNLSSIVLPKEYFTVENFTQTEDNINIFLNEKNIILWNTQKTSLRPKVFMMKLKFQTFLFEEVYLFIKRRRCFNVTNGDTVMRNWELVAKGIRMTKDFAFFLQLYHNTRPVSCKSLGDYFRVNGKLLEEQYRDHLSGFYEWKQYKHQLFSITKSLLIINRLQQE